MEQEVRTPQSDMIVGLATVKAHSNGGWVLPGGWITRSFDQAFEHAARMDCLIGRCGGRARATRQGRWPRGRSA